MEDIWGVVMNVAVTARKNGPVDARALAEAVAQGDRRALARAITLIESTRSDHRELAAELLSHLPKDRSALRIGLSGTPGVGKSTLIEAFGLMLINEGLRVAVLAVDPSSARSGGSILGDKTRMELLSREPAAFIRPSPSSAELGGVGRRTREAVSLCEAAGFDVVLIETVGVGQSETIVAEMSDLFVLLLAPAGGDELQGVKRGIMEMADLILVNKADGPLRETAMRTVSDYKGALHLLRKREGDPEGWPRAMPVSAIEGNGLAEAWAAMQELHGWRKDCGFHDRKRNEQLRQWFEADIRQALLGMLKQEPVASLFEKLGNDVMQGRKTSGVAAKEVLDLFSVGKG